LPENKRETKKTNKQKKKKKTEKKKKKIVLTVPSILHQLQKRLSKARKFRTCTEKRTIVLCLFFEGFFSSPSLSLLVGWG
jgi:hypothetical protein